MGGPTAVDSEEACGECGRASDRPRTAAGVWALASVSTSANHAWNNRTAAARLQRKSGHSPSSGEISRTSFDTLVEAGGCLWEQLERRDMPRLDGGEMAAVEGRNPGLALALRQRDYRRVDEAKWPVPIMCAEIPHP